MKEQEMKLSHDPSVLKVETSPAFTYGWMCGPKGFLPDIVKPIIFFQ